MSKGRSHFETYDAHEPPPKSLNDSKVAVFSMERWDTAPRHWDQN